MFLSALAQWFYNLVSVLFSDFSFEFAIPYESLNVFREILNVATYFFPLGAIRAIIVCILSLQIYRIWVSLWKTIWAVLPVF